MIKNFTDLKVWQEAHKFVLAIYKITMKFPRHEMFGIVSQLRRASVSINANIAEGFGRYHYKDKIRFYYQARGSAAEVASLLIICRDLKYLTINTYNKLSQQIKEIGQMLSGLINSVSKSPNP